MPINHAPMRLDLRVYAVRACFAVAEWHRVMFVTQTLITHAPMRLEKRREKTHSTFSSKIIVRTHRRAGASGARALLRDAVDAVRAAAQVLCADTAARHAAVTPRAWLYFLMQIREQAHHTRSPAKPMHVPHCRLVRNITPASERALLVIPTMCPCKRTMSPCVLQLRRDTSRRLSLLRVTAQGTHCARAPRARTA